MVHTLLVQPLKQPHIMYCPSNQTRI